MDVSYDGAILQVDLTLQNSGQVIIIDLDEH